MYQQIGSQQLAIGLLGFPRQPGTPMILGLPRHPNNMRLDPSNDRVTPGSKSLIRLYDPNNIISHSQIIRNRQLKIKNDQYDFQMWNLPHEGSLPLNLTSLKIFYISYVIRNFEIHIQKSSKAFTCFIQQVTARTAQDIIPNRQFVKTLMSKFLPIRGYSSIPYKNEKHVIRKQAKKRLP